MQFPSLSPESTVNSAVYEFPETCDTFTVFAKPWPPLFIVTVGAVMSSDASIVNVILSFDLAAVLLTELSDAIETIVRVGNVLSIVTCEPFDVEITVGPLLSAKSV